MVVLLNCFWKRHNVGVCIIPQPSKQDLSRAKSFGRAFLLFLANGGYILWNHVNRENIWNVFRSHWKEKGFLVCVLSFLNIFLDKSLSLSLSLFFLVYQTWGFNNVPKSPVWTPSAESHPYLVCILMISPVLGKFSGSPTSSKSSKLWVSKTVSDSSKR